MGFVVLIADGAGDDGGLLLGCIIPSPAGCGHIGLHPLLLLLLVER